MVLQAYEFITLLPIHLLYLPLIMSFSNAVSALSFVPRDLVAVNIGRHSLNLYPCIDATMPVYERAHAFQVNKTAIMDAAVDLNIKINALGVQLNASTSVDGLKAEWKHLFETRWMDLPNLEILSFHDSTGAIMVGTTLPNNPSILKDVANGPVADCRMPDVRFVRVKLTLDFTPLLRNPLPAGGIQPVLKADYYIELPQTSVAVLNGNGVARNLVTWHGAADLRTLTADQVKTDILQQCFQDSPILIKQTDSFSTTVRTDSTEIMETITNNILKIALPTILSNLFMELCPNYSDQPHAAIEHICQTYQDKEGNTVTSSVQAYHSRLMAAARPFVTQEVFPVSICNRYIDNLDPRLLPAFKKYFAQYADAHPRERSYQLPTLQRILAAATTAEEEVSSIRQLSREAVGQSFHTDVVSPTNASSHPSQAEHTLSRYKEGKSSPTPSSTSRMECFGCGGPHPFGKRGEDGKSIILCPNKDKPGIIEKGEKNYNAWNLRMQKRRGQRKRKNFNTANFEDFNDEAKERIRKQVLLTTASVSVTHATSPTVTPPTHRVFVVDAQVLSANKTNKPSLPVQIEHAMPHIMLQLGSEYDTGDSPYIRCMVDTAAGLTTGNFHFVANLAKRYPQCLQRIYVPEDYSPIVLSGIVQRSDNDIVTTELSVAFEFKLPYLTRDDQTTSLIIATGPNVTVNAILGLPFIKATGMIIDTNDASCEMKALACPPFTIEFRRAQNTIPPPEPAASAAAVRARDQYSSIIDDIERVEAYFTDLLSNPVASTPTRSVSFDIDTTPASRTSERNLRWGIVPPSANYVDRVSDALAGGNVGL